MIMRKNVSAFSFTALWMGLTIILMILLSCTAGRPPVGREVPGSKIKPKINSSNLEKEVHALINKERRKRNITPLEWDGLLARIARKHSRDMADRSHQTSGKAGGLKMWTAQSGLFIHHLKVVLLQIIGVDPDVDLLFLGSLYIAVFHLHLFPRSKQNIPEPRNSGH